MMQRFEPAFLLGWSMITAGLSFADVQHPIRTVFALFFLAFVPGLAITRVLRFETRTTRLLLVLPTSLSLAALVSAALVYSGFPSWDLGLSVLLTVAVGVIAVDLARASNPARGAARPSRLKLDDELRQAELIDTLMEGGTLAEAAQAAGVTMATLQRALRRSDRLRMAVNVAIHGQLEAADDATDNNVQTPGRSPGSLGS